MDYKYHICTSWHWTERLTWCSAWHIVATQKMIASLSSARRVSCVTMQRRLWGQWSVEAGENRPRMSKINLGLKRFIFKWAIPSLFFYIFRLFNADFTTVHKLFSGTKITDACLNRNSQCGKVSTFENSIKPHSVRGAHRFVNSEIISRI